MSQIALPEASRNTYKPCTFSLKFSFHLISLTTHFPINHFSHQLSGKAHFRTHHHFSHFQASSSLFSFRHSVDVSSHTPCFPAQEFSSSSPSMMNNEFTIPDHFITTRNWHTRLILPIVISIFCLPSHMRAHTCPMTAMPITLPCIIHRERASHSPRF